ncbi:MAG TPA: hypothetical protein VGM10_29625 [Actinocrinis sp.]|jgi:hypothetical protein
MQVVEVTGLSVRSAVISMCRRETPLTFALFPVFRVASPAFYRQVRARLRECGLILAEGTGPAVPSRLAPRLRRSGLALQGDNTLLPDGVAVVRPDPAGAQHEARAAAPGRRYGLGALAAPLAGLRFAIRGPRMFFGEDLKVGELSFPYRSEYFKAADPSAGANEQCGEQLHAALGRIHREHAREPMTVGVVCGAPRIPAVARDLNASLGYRLREAEWLTVALLARRAPSGLPGPAAMMSPRADT